MENVQATLAEKKKALRTWLRLLGKCFMVLLPFWLVWGYIWARPMAYIDREASFYFWNREQTTKNHGKVYKVLILGDSLGNDSYVPELLGPDVLNLALASTSPCDNYYILKEWLEHNPAPQAIFLTFGDSHLGRWDSSSKTFYGHRFPMATNLDILLTAGKFQEQSVLKSNSWLDWIAYELWMPHKYITSLLNSGFNQRKGENQGLLKRVELHSGRYVSTINEYSETKLYTYQHFSVAPFFDHYLRRTLDLCRKHAITVHFVKTPLAENRSFSKSYRQEWHNYYKNLQREYVKLQYTWLEQPYPQNFYFNDGRHFNDRGALRFSRELRQLFPQTFPQRGALQPRLSDKQVAAISDNLRRVAKLSWLTEWAAEGPYTLLFCDRQGSFANSSYGAEVQLLQSGGKNLPVSLRNYRGEAEGLRLEAIKEGQLKVSGAGIAPYTWNVLPGCLSVLVIDRQSRQVVTVKNFRQQTADWVLAK